MNILKSLLPSTNFAGKRVFLRADLNVPLYNGAIISDLKLHALRPTLDMILEKSGKIILATHIDRPKGYDPSLSTQILIPWLTAQGYTVAFEADLKQAYAKSFHDPKTILLLDNLRFFPEEKGHDAQFAQSLARLGDYYVNDAFGAMHRLDCSVAQVPQLFTADKRMFGLLVERELANAQRLLNPEKPFTLIIGGNKTSDKIPLIKQLLPHIDTLLLCPAPVFTFLKAENKPVGTSLVDNDAIDSCLNLKNDAQRYNVTIKTPLDYMVSHDTFHGPFYIVPENKLSNIDYGISIGPITKELFGEIIANSKTIFYNGLMGDLNHPETLEGVQALFTAMANSNGYCVIGGGDSTAAAQILGLAQKVDFLSTGGGALIAYLSNQQLPALEILINK